jgi:hypothetical protein
MQVGSECGLRIYRTKAEAKLTIQGDAGADVIAGQSTEER